MVKFILSIFVIFVSVPSLGTVCSDQETTMQITQSYQCEGAQNQKNYCVNYGDFLFEERKVLRIFEIGTAKYDEAIFFDRTALVKCIWGISSCEWVRDRDSMLEAKRRIVPMALNRESQTYFKLDKEDGTARLTKTLYNDEGEKSDVQAQDFQDCKAL